MKRRGLLLILSVIVAAVGTGLIALYVKGADDRAADGQRQVEVLVAAQPIEPGVSAEDIADTSLVTVKMPLASVPQTAITGPGAVDKFAAAFKGKISAVKIPVRQAIVPESFSTLGKAVSGGLPADKMGIVLAMQNPERAIGLITPGGEVTVFYTDAGKISILIPRAKVLAVDSDKAAGTASTRDQRAANTVALAVSVPESKRLILAKKQGDTLYLGVPGAELSAADLDTKAVATVKELAP